MAFEGATTQGQAEFKLWSWMTIAGLIVAVIVWGLILWAVIAYRRRDPDRMPEPVPQQPLVEVIYTAVPIIIVGVIFFYTVKTENTVDALAPHPAVTDQGDRIPMGVELQLPELRRQADRTRGDAQSRPPVLAGNPTSSEYPQFVLPLGETTQVVLVRGCRARLLHPGLQLQPLQRYPGSTNDFDFTPVQHRGLCRSLRSILWPVSR